MQNSKVKTEAPKNNLSPITASNLLPSMSLNELREYIGAVVKQRGFDHESPRDIVLLMLEEVGELAKATRKLVGLKIDQQKASSYTSVEEEIADVFFYLLDLCVVLKIDLFAALKNKELKNEKRFWDKS